MDKEIEKYKDGLRKAAKKINELDEQLKQMRSQSDIAIIGYNCCFPEGANNSEEFWSLLSKGYDAVSKVKKERFDVEKYYSEEKEQAGKTYTKYASFLNTDIKTFDHMHFELSAKEATSIDPQHRLLFEVSWEAMENAGLDIEKLKGSKTGVFIGIDSLDYAKLELLSEDVSEITPYSLMGVSQHSAAGRLSYFYDFKGPAIACNTACSSSLVALNTAIDSLRNGQCDLAIVGGVNLLLNPETFIGLSQLQGLSADGRCKTFDEYADGFGRGEGCGVIVLKRLTDAKKDGNTVEALVKGICVGQDGKSNGFYAPNGLSEQKVIKQALKSSGLSANDIDYIEAHGTGTTLGDFIETQAISEVFKEKKEPILVGAVKSNIGHLEAASGMAGLIKVLLSIKHKQIPPSINVTTPNHNINWSKIKVVQELKDWDKAEGKRRAGISAFGISGTLAHVIIEEPDLENDDKNLNSIPYNLLTLSAKSEKALKQSIVDMKQYIINSKTDVENISYSSNITKSYLNHRFAIVAGQKEEIISSMEDALNNEEFLKFNSNAVKDKKNKIAFLFTGQGSIYPNIAKQLYKYSVEFKETLDLCEKLFSDILDISIKEAIFNDEADKLSNPVYSQPIIFSIEYALTKFWGNIEIKPTVVIGHSIGEYAAACYAGLVSLEDATKMIAARGRLMESVAKDGKMVGVLIDVKTMEKAIRESGCQNVSIAAINAPSNVTISGDKAEVEHVIEVLHKSQRAFVNELNILQPFHSVIMKKYEKDYISELKDIKFSKFDIKIISSVTGQLEDTHVLGTSKYWAEHLSKTVNFQAAIEKAKGLGVNVFIEIGGDATLSGLAEQCLTDEESVFIPSLRKGIDDYKQLFTSLKTLYLNDVRINWNKLYDTYKKEKVELTNYPFQRKQLWKELKEKNISEKNISLKKNIEDVIEGIEEMKSENDESKYEQVLSDIIGSVHVITGMDLEEIEPEKELVAFGFDSLLLASLGKQLKIKYNIELSLAKLFTSLNNLDKIARHIIENCDVVVKGDEKNDENNKINGQDNVSQVGDIDTINYANKKKNIAYAEPSVAIDLANSIAAKNIESVQPSNINFKHTTTLEKANYSAQIELANKLFDNQFELMREQNSIFSNIVGSIDVQQTQTKETQKVVTQEQEIVHKKVPEHKQENKKNNTNYYVPYKKLELKDTSNLKDLQLQYVKNIEKKYTTLTQKSKSTTQEYRDVYASNRNSAGFRPVLKEMIYQIIAEKGKGSHLIDIDGNDLVDLTMGFGVSLFGHGPDFVKEALRNEVNNGMPLGPMGRLAGDVARQISELTGVERVFFCNSGTEADMFAVRTARAVTGKNKVVCFRGAFHGTYDGLLGVPTYSDDPDNATLAMAPGITDNAVKDLILLEYNNEESLKYIEEHSDIIAAVLTEPVQSRCPDVQPREFLHKLRKVTEENNVALIFDEIITGFRISAGGAQEYFGVKADIVTYGKVIGGGMPIGIISGKAKYLDSIDGGMWQFGDNSVPPCNEKRTFVAGTFCHHPLAMAATDSVLKYIAANRNTLYDELNTKTSNFAKRMNAFFDEENVPLCINHFGSLFRFSITLDKEIFYYGLLEKGIYIWEGRNCFFSTEHTQEDIDKIVDAVKATIHEMKKAGYFGNFNNPTDDDSRNSLRKEKKYECDDVSITGVDCGTFGEVPMSIIQQRLYSHMLVTESDPYDIVSAYIVKEELDIKKIEAVINKIIERHEILRTSMYLNEGEYKQKVLSEWEFKVREIIQSENLDINATITQSLKKFDLSKAPLLDAFIIRTPQKQKIIVFHFHHTVSDGMSMNMFVEEFSKLYNNEKLPELKKQYKDYVVWEQNYLNSEKLKEDSEYWINSLSDTPKVTAMSYDYPEPAKTKYPANSISDEIDTETLASLKEIAKKNSMTLYMVLLAAVNVLLHKTTGENEIAVSTPVTSRFDGGFEECIGMFTNTIVLKNEIESIASFEEVLKNVKRECLQSYEHTNYPYNELVKKLNLVGQNAFRTEFVYENIGGRTIEQTGLKLENIEYIPSTQEADMTFELLESDGVVDIYLRYRTDLFKEKSIQTLMKRFLLVINQITKNPSMRISDIEIITEKEKKQILVGFNDTGADYPRDKTMYELFEEQVTKAPENIAVVFEDKKLTYKELNEKANALARTLREKGVKADSIVGIMGERSLNVIVGILAILKSGGAYLPIDPNYPEDRIGYILSDSNTNLILTHDGIKKEFNGVELLNLNDERIYSDIFENLDNISSSENLAYVIYTSGTTGNPKGVMMEHKSIANLVLTLNEKIYSLYDNKLRVALVAPYYFDASVQQIFAALTNGSSLHIVSEDVRKNGEALLEYYKLNEIEISDGTPIHLNMLANSTIEKSDLNLKHLIIGGDSLDIATVQSIHKTLGDIKISNVYGPTECCVDSTTLLVEFEEITNSANVSIGKPISNTRIYILGANNKLQPIGVAGELCISGEGLSRGYLNRPELTAEKFVDNPYEPGQKMYKTGDLARWLPDGNIDFLGRIDHQVKIRGFRIELGEIESNILKIEGITSVIILSKDKGDSKYLCAYYVSEIEYSIGDLREALKKSLPDYMIPSYFIKLEKMPLTANGKIDRKALPEPEGNINTGAEYEAPRNQIEKDLCEIFEEIVGVEKVGIKDSFFEIGGHSLSATRLVNKIEVETGYKIAIKEVFNSPTVKELAKLITGKEVEEYIPIPKAEEKEYYPMSSMQKRIYLICQMNDNGTAYNMPGSLKLVGEVHKNAMKDALQEMINRHEILRTRFLIIDGNPVQEILSNVEADYEYEIDETTPYNELMAKFIKPFDLVNPPLVRVKLVKRSDCHILMIDTHHIISDGMSMETFTSEMTALYNGEKLEPLKHQYRDYSEWMTSRDLSKQEDCWINEFSDEIPVLDMPIDHRRPQEQSYKGASIEKAINAELGTKIKNLARKTGTTEYMIFLSAAMVFLSKYSRQEDIIIGSPMSGRTHKDTESMLGMFVNTLAMRAKPEGEKSYLTFLSEIKASCLKAYENQEYPFEELIEKIEVKRDMSRNPLFDVMLVLQNNENEEIKLAQLSTEYKEYKSNVAKFDLSFYVKQYKNSQFTLELEYCIDLYNTETVERMFTHFTEILNQLAVQPEIKLSEVQVTNAEEKEELIKIFNDTYVDYPKTNTVIELFEEQVKKTPNNIALIFEEKKLTYRELNQRANALARNLREKGVCQDSIVGIMAERSIEMIVGIFAILKAGGAYLPIDPEYPEERIEYILKNSQAKILLIQSDFKEQIKVEIGIYDLDNEELYKGSNHNLDKISDANSLAYVIYTSGTTGNPKGVKVSNKNVINTLMALQNYYPIYENGAYLLKTNYAFDVSVSEIFCWFIGGAKLVILESGYEKDVDCILKSIINNSITHINFTSSMFNLFLSQLDNKNISSLKSLKYILTAGEALKIENEVIAKELLKSTKIENLYGPTEASIYATRYSLNSSLENIPIGKPIDNIHIYIVDKNNLLVPIGVYGELCISGVGLAIGYLNNEKLTQEKFIENPYELGQKMYKTGDLARWLPDGNIEYLGRIDEQVKIRGFRIELGEIENAIRKIDYVIDCAVIARSISAGDKAIYAYIVANKEINISKIREKLGISIPQYMIPAYITQIDSIPITRNGKLDRKALPEIKVVTENEFIPPSNDMQVVLCKAFQEVLSIEKVGIKDNFFELGGDSLKAIRVISKVRELGYSITVQNIMQYQVVDKISILMHSIDQSLISDGKDTALFGEVDLGAIQKYFIQSKLYNPNHFNMSAMFELSERISKVAMTQALNSVVQQHDMLRVVLENDKQVIKEYESKNLFEFKIHDLTSCLSKEEARAKIENYIKQSQTLINLNTSPLISVTVFNLKDSDHMHICVNHFVVDAISMRIIVEDIFSAYYYCNNQEVVRLPQKTASYKEWISCLNDFSNKIEFEVEENYWNDINQEVKNVELPITRNSMEKSLSNYNESIEINGLGVLSSKVLSTSMENLLMVAVAKVVCNKYGVDKIAINVEGHGRYDINKDIFVDRTVGWFTSMYPLIIHAAEGFDETLNSMINQMKEVPNNGIGYLLTMGKSDFEEINIPQVTINYIGNIDVSTNSIQSIKTSEFSCGYDIDKMNIFLSSLSVNISTEEDVFKFNFVYDQSLWSMEDIKEIFAGICNILVQEVNDNKTKIDKVLCLGDDKEIEKLVKTSNKEIELYEQQIVSNTKFNDYPITGIQKLSYQFGARNTVIDIPFFDKIDVKKFDETWMQLHHTFDVLRSSISLSHNNNFIRIYDMNKVEIPFVDISHISSSKRNEIIRRVLEDMDCYEEERMYSIEKLSSRVILVKVSETAYHLLASFSHLVFDRFSSEVLKNKLIDIYYDNSKNIIEHSYNNYYKLLRNEQNIASEEQIIKQLGLDRFYKVFNEFYEKNKNRKFETYIYQYSNSEKWAKLTEKEMLKISHTVFVKTMQFIFKDTDIPLLTLHLSRKNKYVNLFEYIGEFLDVLPICISHGEEISIEDVIEEKLSFVQQNNLYFSSLLFSDTNNKYIKLRNMLSEICEKSEHILVYNNTGILKSANNVIVNSEKYRLFYNVMSVVINSDGIFMNVPIDKVLEGSIKDHLDFVINEILREY